MAQVSNPRIADSLIKWKTLPAARIASTSLRLKRIYHYPPSCVPPLRSYGWIGAHGGERLRLEHEIVVGAPLHHLLPALSFAARGRISERLKTLLPLWQPQGFVHGDLSLRNILVAGASTPRPTMNLWCIDWLVDIESKEGTPLFTSADARLGHRSHDSDSYAIAKILCILAT